MRPSLAVLDLAGTTVAATDEVAVALDETFRAAGFPLSADAIRAVRGRHKPNAIRALRRAAAPGTPAPESVAAELHATFRRGLLARYQRHPATPIPGAAISWLRTRGGAVVLTTGFDRELADLFLAQVGRAPPFVRAIVCADDVPHGRPAPDLIHHAMGLVGVDDPAAVVVVGDTVADLKAARAAGAGGAVAVLSGAGDAAALAAEHPNALLASVADLPAWWASHAHGGR